MGTLRYISLIGIICFFTSCYGDEYKKYEDSFFSINLREWNSVVCPKKIVYEKYEKNSNFKKLINSNSDFDTNINCLPKYDKLNKKIPTSPYNDQMTLTPYISYIGQINYDIKLTINDSLEYKITDIQDEIDTIADRGRKKWIIMNNIKSFVVNGHQLDNKNAPLSIEIPTKLGKVIK
ncbi:hypothetical protein BC749_103176 [Flavobacterium araucananum]|uniref:Uncharacterized protein n=1 Tax=Flavobacterium araucananum TaxID=946678 RepID=A0A227PGK2_9FLAO|nr:hypothetical protein [Flavobacterium araucananum]OXG09017.1 hypothetical protein B0A64_03215 [Flavobacterium araucananum]PWJ99796.1 hypothetical protein BC749_103176 [Flavobacterium araucananum]